MVFSQNNCSHHANPIIYEYNFTLLAHIITLYCKGFAVNAMIECIKAYNILAVTFYIMN